MNKAFCVILAMLLSFTICAAAEAIAMPGTGSTLLIIGNPDEDELLQQAMGFLSQNGITPQIMAEARHAPLRAYKLEWPEEQTYVNDKVAEAYGEYSTVIAVHYEIEPFPSPFAYYYLAAVGITEGGDMEVCPTPDEVIAKTYDHATFADFRITLYKFDGIIRDTITVFLPNDAYDGFDAVEAEGQNSAVGLIYALEKAGAVPAGTHILSFENSKLDLSAEFGKAISQTGTTGERLMMGAVVNTFLTNFGLSELMVTSEGHVIETGHMIYDEPQTFFE